MQEVLEMQRDDGGLRRLVRAYLLNRMEARLTPLRHHIGHPTK